MVYITTISLRDITLVPFLPQVTISAEQVPGSLPGVLAVRADELVLQPRSQEEVPAADALGVPSRAGVESVVDDDGIAPIDDGDVPLDDPPIDAGGDELAATVALSLSLPS
ncbi:MAG: hypothetical protein M1837_002835 [Sclerophora amabilis]|nr:MAG: hypothetical protein M1837_002835 [Sclerophora amabilis]